MAKIVVFLVDFSWKKDNLAYQVLTGSPHAKDIISSFNDHAKVKGFFIRMLKDEGVIKEDQSIDKLTAKHIVAIANIITEDNSIKPSFNRKEPTPAPKATLKPS